jgi:hypothetical protein
MNRLVLVAAALCVLCACSPAPAYATDGGRLAQGCYDSTNVLAVKVIDLKGNPITGASVSAINRGSHISVTGTTDGRGVTTAVTESIGAGEIDITAASGSMTSSVFTAQWTCGPCDCVATPSSATLIVQ